MLVCPNCGALVTAYITRFGGIPTRCICENMPPCDQIRHVDKPSFLACLEEDTVETLTNNIFRLMPKHAIGALSMPESRFLFDEPTTFTLGCESQGDGS